MLLGIQALACGRERPGGFDAGPDGGGRYMSHQVYYCCAKGEGTACCEGLPARTCTEYGGLYKDCRGEGQLFEGKVICSFCCPGLQHASRMTAVDGGGDVGPVCINTDPASVVLCIRCGDGVCGRGENRCNCPSDCPS